MAAEEGCRSTGRRWKSCRQADPRRDGRPSTNVEDFYEGGMLLPAAGHKGYSLALAAELLGGALLGEAHELNWLVIALDIAAFRPLVDFQVAAQDFLKRPRGARCSGLR